MSLLDEWDQHFTSRAIKSPLWFKLYWKGMYIFSRITCKILKPDKRGY